MNKKIVSILSLAICFIMFCFLKMTNKTECLYKIIEVIEADEYYIDINKNNKIDENEHFKLEDIIAFKPIKNKITQKEADELGIPIEEYLKNGYISRLWAQEELTGKYVKFISKPAKYDKNSTYRKVHIEFNNENLESKLLKNGLCFLNKNSKNIELLNINSLKQVKNNIKNLSKIKFYIVNLNTNIVHSIQGEHFNNLNNALIILEKHIQSYIPCKVCFNKVHLDINKDDFNIHKSKGVYKTSIYKKFGKLELFLINPLEFNKPSMKCRTKLSKRLIEEINNSKNSIDIAIYGIGEQNEIIEALRKAKQRGVKIRAVVDYSKNMNDLYSRTSQFINEFNAKTDKSTSLMHNKFMIFDDTKIFTGSTNISESGTGGYNANTGIIINSKDIAKEYKIEFEQMYNGVFSKNKLVQNTLKMVTPYFSVKAYFLPQQDLYNEEIIPSIKNAKKEIYVSIFYLTNKELINELINAKARGVDVLVMSDAVCASNFKDRIITLRKANIPTKIENWGGKNHEKTMMIDSDKLIIGSANYTKSGFYKNDENVLVIYGKEIASFYKDYYLYLFNSIDRKYYYYFPRAESFDSGNSCYDGIDNNFDGKIDSEDDGCKK